MRLELAVSPAPRELLGIALGVASIAPPVAGRAAAVALPLQGPPGPPGPPGASGAGYVFTQALASATWVINHNLGFYPGVALYDASGFAMAGSVRNVSTNIVEVTFNSPYAGTARLT